MQRKKASSHNKVRTLFILSLISYPLILFLIFYVFVNLNSIRMAFFNVKLDGTWEFAYFDNFITFIKGLTETGNVIGMSMYNSIRMYLINLVICMPLYLIFSYMLFKQCFMHKAIRIVVMLPQIISGFVICMLFVNFISGPDAPLSMLFSHLKIFIDDKSGMPIDLLYNEKTAFATTIFYGIWISFGTSLIVYPNAMKEISSEVIESAQLDGVSNMFQEMFYIILPLIFPTLSTFLITGLAGIFTEAGTILAFYETNAPDYVHNMGYYYAKLVKNANETTYPMLAAGGLLMTLIVAPVVILVRHLLEKYGPSTEVQ
ncbi:MAG: sugar ABC transporter permease [Clostridia bacterium]|nr:sugar ABC transporter permease [Clostridia bacterium]